MFHDIFTVYMLWSECILPKFICWNTNAQCDAIRRWLGHEGGILTNEIDTFIRKAPERSSLPCEDTEEVSSLQPEVGFHHSHASSLVLQL